MKKAPANEAADKVQPRTHLTWRERWQALFYGMSTVYMPPGSIYGDLPPYADHLPRYENHLRASSAHIMGLVDKAISTGR